MMQKIPEQLEVVDALPAQRDPRRSSSTSSARPGRQAVAVIAQPACRPAASTWPSGSRPCRPGERTISSTTTSSRGTLYPAICSRQYAWMSSSVGRRSPARLHDGDDPLAPPLVGDADHDGVEHAGMGLERRLDLLGEDLLAAGVDAHRTAAEQDDRAVRLDRGHVAGQHPAHAVDREERRRRLLLVVVVPERDVAAPGQPADRSEPGVDRLAVVVEHRGLLVDGEPRTAVAAPRRRPWSRPRRLRRAEPVDDDDVREQLRDASLVVGERIAPPEPMTNSDDVS